MVRILKIMLITLILGGLAVPSVSCTSESDSEALPENQVVTVERGNLTVDITATGNLALSRTAEPAFEVSGTQQEPLTVEEVLVEEGDTVEEGQVLVTLDTTALEQKVTSREQAAKTAELAVNTAELAVTTAEIDLQTAKDAEENVKSTEIDLETTRDNLRQISYPYTYSTFVLDVPEALVAIRDAQRQIKVAKAGLQMPPGTEEYAEALYQFGLAEENLVTARERLAHGIGMDVFQEELLQIEDYWTIRDAKMAVEKAQITLEKAKNSFQSGLEKANVAVDKANVALEKAKADLEEAREDLDTAKDELEKAVVVAPFAGFITMVNVEGGDEVKKGTVAVRIADPGKFEADLMVGEMDILQIKLGGDAAVQIDAMPTLTLPAKVTHISPTADVQQGVVNYKVKVEIQSLEAVKQEPQKAKPEAAPGELPEQLRQAIKEGRVTPEQAEEMMKQRQQGQGGQPGGQPGQRPMVIPKDFQLREGLTVTVNIQVEERKDVLIVPNKAITRRGGETSVQVLKDGVVEQRLIKTGISNFTHTEVTDGLSEGEQVVIGKASTTNPTTSPSSGRGMYIPGMGRR